MTAEPNYWQVDYPAPKPGGYTVADLPGLVLDLPYELVDGEIMMLAPATQWHGEAKILVRDMLRRQAPDDLAVVVEKGVEIREDFAPVPDVLVVDRAKVLSTSLVFEPADVRLVIEVVSPGTRTKDRKHRPVDYAGVGIPNFWLVENENDAMAFHTYELDPASSAYIATGIHRDHLEVRQPYQVTAEISAVTW
ncbi:Uma2 family endonuclease [Actinomadura barringtoniae]|uniref:Uma2 family endonuclease n=1 Tax=Actinomadura barringtoniae TaxID=1427535 RepID=A0A939PJH0_9ACTN|nr:Uma2 family endonuclease [Actinomadura barringtoniae]MBO2449701.1 Uma2 family endonuclease [Actinomadura barringtoniae]